MKESEVKSSVERFFRDQGYYVPPKEFNIGVRPDVSAFRWGGDHEIRSIAVECKKTRWIRPLIETALTQAREYQLAFPYVYLAIPEIKEESREILMGILGSLRMGLLFVGNDGRVKELKEPGISLRLRYFDFLFKVRQRAVAILTYKEVAVDGEPFDLNVQNPLEAHCYLKKEAANFLLANWPDGDYYFGMCIEKKKNVRKTLGKISGETLYKLLRELPEGYLIDLQYIDTSRPREVSWSILRTMVSEISEMDVKWILDYCRKNKWKIRLILHKKVWLKYEVLSKSNHESRVRKAKEEIRPLRQALLSA